MFGKYLHDIIIAVEAILANKLKSVLTALGIIFGVAAVISMLAIGSGAQQEILEQIKLVGVNNIIIEPIVDQTSSGSSEGRIRVQTLQQRTESFGCSCHKNCFANGKRS
jgi:putative ABC transport system permease protein